MDVSTANVLYVTGAALGCASLFLQFLVVDGRRFTPSPTALFLLVQLPYWVGTWAVVDPQNENQSLWFAVLGTGMLAVSIGAVLANRVHHYDCRRELAPLVRRPVIDDLSTMSIRYPVYITLVLSCVVGFVYVEMIGYNVFFQSLRQFLTLGLLDPVSYSTDRVTISTTRYVASGYVSQFTAILLPAFAAIMYFRVKMRRSRMEIGLLAIVCVADVWFMTAAGVRGWVVFAGGGFLLLISPWGPLPLWWRRTRTLFAVLTITIFLFYTVAAVLMGRADRDSPGFIGVITGGSNELYERTIGSEAELHMQLMEYYLDEPPQWGKEWLEELYSALPVSNKGMSAGNYMYAFLHRGDSGGSMGLTAFGSLVYNWGVWLTLLFLLGVGFGYQSFWISMLRGPRFLSRIVILFFAGVRLALVRDPYSFLLQGAFTLVAFEYMLYLFRRMRWQAAMAPITRPVTLKPGTSVPLADVQLHSVPLPSSLQHRPR